VYSIAAALAMSASLSLAGTPTASAEDKTVMIVDQEAPQTPGNNEQGSWGYAPFHISAAVGDKITFVQGETAFRPHTVTSVTWEGQGVEKTLTAGALFNSSPTRETTLTKGQSYVLDTAPMQPGQYLYYCALHPWMVGTISLMAPAVEAPAPAAQ
jgi:plastocyanin